MLLTMMNAFTPEHIPGTPYVFFTGKGGVGKTSVACAAAISLADAGRRVLLVSTDPASNLQDVFATPLDGRGTPIAEAPGLTAANLDPIQAAAEYRESVVAPYRGRLPESVVRSMEEQLSGSCTVEIAAFNAFSHFLTDPELARAYDHILFDTAPTGHTLRMLQLPSAWNRFIQDNTHGASCLGQLSGLEEKKEMYKNAAQTLADGGQTTLILVARPETSPLREAERASGELAALGVRRQVLVINGVLAEGDDPVSDRLAEKQRAALAEMPEGLRSLPAFTVPLRSYNVEGVDKLRAFLRHDQPVPQGEDPLPPELPGLRDVVDALDQSGKKVIFTMGKGGVGKTTIACAVARGLAARGKRVHLTTTDPAAHLTHVLDASAGLSLSYIDERAEWDAYREEVLSRARETLSEADVAYVEEDLRSPCTQEIAVFRAFARLVERAGEEVVVIDTAPTGHTLLLLDATLSHHREIKRTQGEIPEAVARLLPRLRDPAQTEVVIVALAEATPVYEAMRLEEDLKRAGLHSTWWVVNAALSRVGTTNATLRAKAESEAVWIRRIHERTNGHMAVVGWRAEEPRGDALLEL